MLSLRSLLCATIAALSAVDFADAAYLKPSDLDKYLLSSYDYLIVGGGPSGLTVANRLTEDPNVKVLLVEAGYLDYARDVSKPQTAVLAIPGFTAQPAAGKAMFNWNLTTANLAWLDNHVASFGQGTGIGGGTLINGMVWTRGAKSDFDAWKSLGNSGWGWDDMLPYFMKSETFSNNLSPEDAQTLGVQPDMSKHGDSGPISVAWSNYHYDQNVNFLKGWQELGLDTSPDINSGDASGAVAGPWSIDATKQTRSDARVTTFVTTYPRPRIHIVNNMRVTKLVLAPEVSGQPRRVAGFNMQGARDGKTYYVKANREVIMAAGAIFTPTLLQVSGIGNSATLPNFGITPLVNTPGVGSNFQDHPIVGVPYTYGNDSVITSTKLYNTPLGTQYLNQYVQSRTGPYTLSTVNAIAFPPLSSLVSDAMDWISRWVSSAQDNLDRTAPAACRLGYAAQKVLLNQQLLSNDVGILETLASSTGSLSVATQKVFSRGFVVPKSNNIWDGPLVNPRYCSNAADCDTLVLGIQTLNKLVATDAFKELQVAIPDEFNTNDRTQLLKLIKAKIGTEFHPAGTAAMMPENLGGVVDSNLKVYGFCNLRIVDASIMPIIPSAHLQATVYAVAEKAADLIKAGGYCSA